MIPFREQNKNQRILIISQGFNNEKRKDLSRSGPVSLLVEDLFIHPPVRNRFVSREVD
jgi:hypothetical protein